MLKQIFPMAEPANALVDLINRMSADRQLSFKQALVRQALHYAAQQLPPLDQDDGERRCLSFAQDWLDEPTPEKAEEAGAGASFDCVDGGVRHFDYSDYFLEPAWAAAGDAANAARCALIAAGSDAAAAQLWQIATAKAILTGADLPPLPLGED
jgi:hypothetical protein